MAPWLGPPLAMPACVHWHGIEGSDRGLSLDAARARRTLTGCTQAPNPIDGSYRASTLTNLTLLLRLCSALARALCGGRNLEDDSGATNPMEGVPSEISFGDLDGVESAVDVAVNSGDYNMVRAAPRLEPNGWRLCSVRSCCNFMRCTCLLRLHRACCCPNAQPARQFSLCFSLPLLDASFALRRGGGFILAPRVAHRASSTVCCCPPATACSGFNRDARHHGPHPR